MYLTVESSLVFVGDAVPFGESTELCDPEDVPGLLHNTIHNKCKKKTDITGIKMEQYQYLFAADEDVPAELNCDQHEVADTHSLRGDRVSASPSMEA